MSSYFKFLILFFGTTFCFLSSIFSQKIVPVREEPRHVPVLVNNYIRVIDAEIELLNGFEFNDKAILSTIAFMGFTPSIMRALGTHAIAVDAFNAARDVSAPTGTTHLKLVGSASSIDFEAKDSDGVTVTSALIPYANDVVAAQTLALPLPAASAHPIVVVFGVEFYQEVNGKQYLLGNGAYTTAKIVAVDGGV